METNSIKTLVKKEVEGDKDLMLEHMTSLKNFLKESFETEKKALNDQLHDTR